MSLLHDIYVKYAYIKCLDVHFTNTIIYDIEIRLSTILVARY